MNKIFRDTSHRITTTDLYAMLGRLQRETGARAMRWTERPDGRGSQCPVGAYMINPGSAIHGRAWSLLQTVNDDGVARTILRANTARELYDMMVAYYLEETKRREQ